MPANLNAPGQVVIAGHAAPVRRALEIAKERGASMSVELKVSAPFHCPLMQPARDGMEPVLRALKVGEFKFGVIANVTAEVNRDPARVVPLLLEQITSPVRWEESMGVVARSGITDAIEFGCGRVLMGLMRRTYRTIRVRPLEDLASLKAVSEPGRRRQSLSAAPCVRSFQSLCSPDNLIPTLSPVTSGLRGSGIMLEY